MASSKLNEKGEKPVRDLFSLSAPCKCESEFKAIFFSMNEY